MILRGPRDTDLWKNLKLKISCQTPFRKKRIKTWNIFNLLYNISRKDGGLRLPKWSVLGCETVSNQLTDIGGEGVYIKGWQLIWRQIWRNLYFALSLTLSVIYHLAAVYSKLWEICWPKHTTCCLGEYVVLRKVQCYAASNCIAILRIKIAFNTLVESHMENYSCIDHWSLPLDIQKSPCWIKSRLKLLTIRTVWKNYWLFAW